ATNEPPNLRLPCRQLPIEERPAEDAREMMWVEAAQDDFVRAGAKLGGNVDVPLELIVGRPPGLAIGAVGDRAVVHPEPCFVEQAGEHQVDLAGELLGA